MEPDLTRRYADPAVPYQNNERPSGSDPYAVPSPLPRTYGGYAYYPTDSGGPPPSLPLPDSRAFKVITDPTSEYIAKQESSEEISEGFDDDPDNPDLLPATTPTDQERALAVRTDHPSISAPDRTGNLALAVSEEDEDKENPSAGTLALSSWGKGGEIVKAVDKLKQVVPYSFSAPSVVLPMVSLPVVRGLWPSKLDLPQQHALEIQLLLRCSRKYPVISELWLGTIEASVLLKDAAGLLATVFPELTWVFDWGGSSIKLIAGILRCLFLGLKSAELSQELVDSSAHLGRALDGKTFRIPTPDEVVGDDAARVDPPETTGQLLVWCVRETASYLKWKTREVTSDALGTYASARLWPTYLCLWTQSIKDITEPPTWALNQVVVYGYLVGKLLAQGENRAIAYLRDRIQEPLLKMFQTLQNISPCEEVKKIAYQRVLMAVLASVNRIESSKKGGK